MPLVTGTLDQIGHDAWDQFVGSHPGAGLYHASSWHRAIEETYKYQTLYHVLLGSDQSIQAAIPSLVIRNFLLGRRIVSYPYSDYCDPLLSKTDDLQPLLDSLRRQAQRSGCPQIELRMLQNLPELTTQRTTPYSTYLICLDKTEDELLSSFHLSCIQRPIKKARAAGVEIVEANDPGHLRDFYQLHLQTRKRLGVPAQPFVFFQNLLDLFKGAFHLYLARHEDRFVAGLISLHFKERAYYKFGASDAQFHSSGANQLLMWTAVKRALQKTLHSFDLGRASVSDEGLTQYKLRWGAEPRDLYYLPIQGEADFDRLETSASLKVFRSVLQKLPLAATKWSGSLLYRHLG